MKLLDLFCGAGGAAVGYARAGFDVTGVDIRRQPRYPFAFRQEDALTVLDELLIENPYDIIHASPPCQFYSNGAKKWGTTDSHPDLIDPVRQRLLRLGVPYIIENIEAARAHLRQPIMLCGQPFGLGVFRHRLFESSLPLTCAPHEPHIGRIGDGRFHTVTGHAGGSSIRDGWKGGSTADWKIAMGIDWMSGAELAEAIPPAYTEFIGHQLYAQLKQAV